MFPPIGSLGTSPYRVQWSMCKLSSLCAGLSGWCAIGSSTHLTLCAGEAVTEEEWMNRYWQGVSSRQVLTHELFPQITKDFATRTLALARAGL